jgi:DNA polymerase-3 subunit delta'
VLYSELDPNTGALKIETVREVASRLALKPFEARYRVAIFRDFDHAQPRAQDALLKTLEEPPPHALLILLAQSTDVLLPTITSRSQVLPLRLVPAAQVAQALVDGWGAEPDQAALLAQLSGGRIGWAVQALTDPTALDARAQALEMLEQCLGLNRAGRFALAGDLSKDKLALVALLEVWQTWWRDLLLVREGSGLAPSNVDREATLQEWAQRLTADEVRRALRATRETLGWLAHNVNTRLALEVLLLDYPGLVRA